MEKKKIALIAIVGMLLLAFVIFSLSVSGVFPSLENTPAGDVVKENFDITKNLDIWFMLILVAFLMMFIKKFEWGVALAVILSAAGSYVIYLLIQDVAFDAVWNQALLIRAVVCAITVVIAIGVFVGTIKMWQYLLVGVFFAPVYAFIEFFFFGSGNLFGFVAKDAGGSILVHMAAAYFGLGVMMALRYKDAFKEPMHTTTHSVTFVWLAAMLLWMLWPSFVTAMLPADLITWATITCYMSGIGSMISAYVVCTLVQGKVNPLIYTYAMLAGPVAIGTPLLLVGPWAALAIGLIAGAVSALCFMYLQGWFCKKIGVLDVMGVHNLHGICGWIAVIVSMIIFIAQGNPMDAVHNIVIAVAVVAFAIICGMAVGAVVRATRGKMEVLFDDDTDFIKNEAPEKT